MIVELAGYLLRLSARIAPGDASHDRDQLGAELLRLGRSDGPESTSSR